MFTFYKIHQNKKQLNSYMRIFEHEEIENPKKHSESMVQDRMILINTNNDDCRFHTKISFIFLK